MDVILEESSRRLWEALGEVLLENLFLKNKYGWISLAGNFPSGIFANWTYELCALDELLYCKNVNCIFQIEVIQNTLLLILNGYLYHRPIVSL